MVISFVSGVTTYQLTTYLVDWVTRKALVLNNLQHKNLMVKKNWLMRQD
jgi:hypothetical protein